MVKQTLVFFVFGFISYFSCGQALTCEELAKQMEADTIKSIWDDDNISPDTYYCLGKYFAQRDIDKKIFLIQSYGSPESANPCIVCRYKSYGFIFYYHFDIILERVTRFIEGYNEVSMAYLKAAIGDSAFMHLNDIPKAYFNPRELLSKEMASGNHNKYVDVSIINDTTINVKLIVDSLFKDHPLFLTKVVYRVTDCNSKNKTPEQVQVLNYHQIKENGFFLTKHSSGRYYLKISFDFKGAVNEDECCWCASMDNQQYSYVIPLTVEQ